MDFKSTSIQNLFTHAGTVKVIYCQYRQKFFSANWAGNCWAWNERTERDVIFLIRQGWTAMSVPNIAEVLE